MAVSAVSGGPGRGALAESPPKSDVWRLGPDAPGLHNRDRDSAAGGCMRHVPPLVVACRRLARRADTGGTEGPWGDRASHARADRAPGLRLRSRSSVCRLGNRGRHLASSASRRTGRSVRHEHHVSPARRNVRLRMHARAGRGRRHETHMVRARRRRDPRRTPRRPTPRHRVPDGDRRRRRLCLDRTGGRSPLDRRPRPKPHPGLPRPHTPERLAAPGPGHDPCGGYDIGDRRVPDRAVQLRRSTSLRSDAEGGCGRLIFLRHA
jgi:hypothetical protein